MKVSFVEQMRSLDRRAIEEFNIPDTILMENAGEAVYFVIYNEYGIILQKRLFGSNLKRKLMVKMFASNNKLIDKVGEIFIHITPYKEGE